MSSDRLQDQVSNWFNELHRVESSDPIKACPASVLSLLPSRPSSLIKLAHSKIHSYQFSQVPTCWRRLYTDASISRALGITSELVRQYPTDVWDRSPSKQNGGMVWDESIDNVIYLLDMAQIIAGAPEREEMIEDILAKLQAFVQDQDPSHPRKRRKVDVDTFPRLGVNVPNIRYDIARMSSPSMSAFEEHLHAAQPLVITATLSHWPAFKEHPWKSPSYLLEETFGGRRLIPVELGRSYTDEGWGQTITTFKDFMNRFMLTSNPSAEIDGKGIAYLAQHDLFAQIPSLRKDITIPDYCYTDPPPPEPGTPLASIPAPSHLDDPLLNAWFGPPGTVSPLHTDPYHNVLCQVVGRKYVRLYAPQATKKLYPRDIGNGGVDMSNTSQVDAEGDEHDIEEKFPLFRKAEYVETILDEGEALYIPVGWWHYVRSLDVSFSVSFWWN